jgi:hypothetical protein
VTADRRLAALGAVLVALVLAGLALHHPGAENIRPMWRVYAFVLLLAAGGVAYGFAIRLVLRAPPPHATRTVLLVAAILRAAVLPATPFLSSDVYRYVWDGRVQAAGVNPYRYLPADPTLQLLRDDAIYSHVNRRTYARTIYPPMAQIVFRIVAGISDSVVAMKAAMVAFEALAMAAMMRLLHLLRLPRARVLVYAWNPLGVWAFAGNGHVDAIAIGLLAALLLQRAMRRNTAAGALLAAATLVKFLPLIVAPAIWRRWDWRLPVAFAATLIGLYALYIDAGWQVLGFLPGYSGEEGLGGDGFYLLAAWQTLMPLPSWAMPVYLLLAAAGLIALGGRFAFAPPIADPASDGVRACRQAAILAAAVIVAVSPHYPWYFVWLALPCCVCPLPSVIFLSVAPAIQYLNPWDERFIWPSLVYVPFAALALRDLRRHAGARDGRPACRQPA